MKPDFGDFHKFTTSVGIALIAASILAPWFYLRENSYFLISQEQLNSLPNVSKEAIEDRRDTINNLSFVIFPVSAALFILGAVILYQSVCQWRKRQAVINRKDDLEVARFEADLRVSSMDQVISSAERDTAPDISDRVDEFPAEPGVPSRVERYLALQAEFGRQLRKCVDRSYEALANQRLRDMEFDYVVLSLDRHNPDYLIEMKGYDSSIPFERINSAIERVRLGRMIYTSDTGRSAKLIVIVVRMGAGAVEVQSDRLRRSISEADQTANGLVVWITSRERLLSIGCRELREVLDGESSYRVD